MKVTDTDRIFYNNAMESLTQRFEIAREFHRNNGMRSLPMEELTNLMIVGLKEWLVGLQGEQWLSTIGYIKCSVSGMAILSSGSFCPVCSGYFPEALGRYCESCGRFVCDPCLSIVDPIYDIGWCNDCVSKNPLTNLLVYNE